ncbi:hypothetical protein EAE99_000443 [Botrytis elliptica]|nr:hypothetical protein EAE99_000443 [Botrytis elliptica]
MNMNQGIKYTNPKLNDNSKKDPKRKYYFKDNNMPISKKIHLKYNEKLKEYKNKSKRALVILKSIISMDLIDRFKDKTTLIKLWDIINKIYGEISLDIIKRYFNRLIESNYNDFTYVIWIVFNGLNDLFDLFKSRKIEELSKDLNNNNNIDLDKLISELIFEESRMKSFIESNRIIKPQNTIPNCIFYNKKGYLEEKCFKKHPELYNKDYKKSKNSSKNTLILKK